MTAVWFEGCRKVVWSGCCPAEGAGTSRRIQEIGVSSDFVALVNIRSEVAHASVLTAWQSETAGEVEEGGE